MGTVDEAVGGALGFSRTLSSVFLVGFGDSVPMLDMTESGLTNRSIGQALLSLAKIMGLISFWASLNV